MGQARWLPDLIRDGQRRMPSSAAPAIWVTIIRIGPCSGDVETAHAIAHGPVREDDPRALGQVPRLSCAWESASSSSGLSKTDFPPHRLHGSRRRSGSRALLTASLLPLLRA